MRLLTILLAVLICGTAFSQEAHVESVLKSLDIRLRNTERPAVHLPTTSSVDVTLIPQDGEPGPRVVSFGVPFPPALLDNVERLSVAAPAGDVAVFAKPLAYWWNDGTRGSIRSALVQFEMSFDSPDPITVSLYWAPSPTTPSRPEVDVTSTVDVITVDGHSYRRPRVLALLPADWLCASGLVGPQVPADLNQSAPWFDRYLLESLPGSYDNIAVDGFAPHLFDRASAYVKAYVRHGDAEMLLAALRSADFYIAHLGDDGFFTRKPGDFKYVFTEGQALAYLLTGDPRYREAVDRALKGWEGWGRIEYRGEGFWTERHTGFGLLAHLHAYELNGDPALLAKAKRFFDGVHRMQIEPLHGGPPDGGWLRGRDQDEDGDLEWFTSPWMSAFLCDGIWKYWLLTGDDRCPASLAMYARFILHHGLTDDGTSLLYLAAGAGHGESVVATPIAHNVEGAYLLALGHYFAGGATDAYRNAIEKLWHPVVKQNANAPPRRFTWTFRETSLLVWLLQERRGAWGAGQNPEP